jgi:putative endonuclease
MGYSLYILRSKVSDKYYTGISQNPEARLRYHNTLEKGFTSGYRPWEIVFVKEYPNKEQAQRIEKKIKNWKSKIMIKRILTGETKV